MKELESNNMNFIGIGKGIALQLAQNGAIVYITGRTLKPKQNRFGGSLEETREEVG